MARHVRTFELKDDSGITLYEHILNQHDAGVVKITRDEFIFAKNGRFTDPVITVWYRDIED